MINKSYRVSEPNTVGNPHPDKWLCEVRDGGWIADWQRFDTKEQAEEWGKNHNGETAQKASQAIAEMAKRWANK